MSDNKHLRTIKEFKDLPLSPVMIKQAFSVIKPSKEDWLGMVLCSIISLVFAVIISIAPTTIEYTIDILGLLLTVLLALFACIFTVYSIILIFLSDSYIKKLAKIDYANGSSYLKESTAYYGSVLFLYVINIGITGVVLILLRIIPPDFILTNNNVINAVLACILLVGYFILTVRTIYEIKSTIYNTVILFRGSIAYRFIAFAKEEEKDDNDNEN